MIDVARENRVRYLRRCRMLVALCVVTSAFYVWWLLVDARAANPVLFRVLLGAELFNIVQAAGFWYTIWVQRWTDPPDADFSRSNEHVDAFVTVYGEPADVVEQTVAAAVAIRHPRLTVWVLDDGKSAEVAAIAARYGAQYLTREDHRGAKAGNVNNALRQATGDFVVIFDADHIPLPSFLERTMACFADVTVAFVQTPQSYRNRDVNRVAAGSHEQQALFYGPILRGKNAVGAVFSCGTNVVFRRAALGAISGMPEDSITEDLRMSLVLDRLGWTSVYVSEVLAHGLGPVDVRSFFKQQARWARGGLEILLHHHPFHRGMRPAKALQYGLSFMYWFTGWAYVGYLVLPIAFLLFGLRPVQVPNEYPSHFLPYVFTTLFTMAYATGFTLTFRALWFTLAAFPVHVAAFFTSVFGGVAKFAVTSKGAAQRSLSVVWPQLLLIVVLVAASVVGIARAGATPSVLNNVAFAIGHVLIISGFVRLALDPEGRELEAEETASASASADATDIDEGSAA